MIYNLFAFVPCTIYPRYQEIAAGILAWANVGLVINAIVYTINN